MNKIKKILRVFLLTALVLCTSVGAFASDDVTAIFNGGITTSPQAASVSNNAPADPTLHVVLDGRLKDLSPPSRYHDLSEGSYRAGLEMVKAGVLYTNRYFSPNSNDRIDVSYNVSSDGVYGCMRIGLYDCTSRKMVTTWDTEYTSFNTAGDMYFYNLDSTHDYAITFQGIRDGMGSIPTFSGMAIISH